LLQLLRQPSAAPAKIKFNVSAMVIIGKASKSSSELTFENVYLHLGCFQLLVCCGMNCMSNKAYAYPDAAHHISTSIHVPRIYKSLAPCALQYDSHIK